MVLDGMMLFCADYRIIQELAVNSLHKSAVGHAFSYGIVVPGTVARVGRGCPPCVIGGSDKTGSALGWHPVLAAQCPCSRNPRTSKESAGMRPFSFCSKISEI